MSLVVHEKYMQMALALANKGLWSTWPNPRVGCVIVKEDQVIGAGYHAKAGEAHAEVAALTDARRQGHDVFGSTAYVTLEPCSHHGRTPPCADALIEARCATVVCATTDPNPQVAGKGFQRLREAGLEVIEDVLRSQAEALNIGYFTRHRLNRPYVRVKVAMSLDGKVAMHSGESQWITSSAAREDVHLWRARSDAIITGVGTVIHDNPSLTARPTVQEGFEPIKQPLRIILDRSKRMPKDATLLHDGYPVQVEHSNNLDQILNGLTQQQINECFVEAGPSITTSFIQAKRFDELFIYLAPKILGQSAKSFFNESFERLADAQGLKLLDTLAIGPDVRLRFSIA